MTSVSISSAQAGAAAITASRLPKIIALERLHRPAQLLFLGVARAPYRSEPSYRSVPPETIRRWFAYAQPYQGKQAGFPISPPSSQKSGPETSPRPAEVLIRRQLRLAVEAGDDLRILVQPKRKAAPGLRDGSPTRETE